MPPYTTSNPHHKLSNPLVPASGEPVTENKFIADMLADINLQAIQHLSDMEGSTPGLNFDGTTYDPRKRDVKHGASLLRESTVQENPAFDEASSSSSSVTSAGSGSDNDTAGNQDIMITGGGSGRTQSF